MLPVLVKITDRNVDQRKIDRIHGVQYIFGIRVLTFVSLPFFYDMNRVYGFLATPGAFGGA